MQLNSRKQNDVEVARNPKIYSNYRKNDRNCLDVACIDPGEGHDLSVGSQRLQPIAMSELTIFSEPYPPLPSTSRSAQAGERGTAVSNSPVTAGIPKLPWLRGATSCPNPTFAVFRSPARVRDQMSHRARTTRAFPVCVGTGLRGAHLSPDARPSPWHGRFFTSLDKDGLIATGRLRAIEACIGSLEGFLRTRWQSTLRHADADRHPKNPV